MLTTLTLVIAAAAPLPSSATPVQGQVVGSWVISETIRNGDPQHVAMTLSSQGSGVLAFRCVGERAGLLLGLNRASFRSSIGSRIPLRYEIGNQSAETDGAVVSDETLELDEDVARSVMAHTTDAHVLSFTLPYAVGQEVTLVCRPVETTRALKQLKAACGIRE